MRPPPPFARRPSRALWRRRRHVSVPTACPSNRPRQRAWGGSWDPLSLARPWPVAPGALGLGRRVTGQPQTDRAPLSLLPLPTFLPLSARPESKCSPEGADPTNRWIRVPRGACPSRRRPGSLLSGPRRPPFARRIPAVPPTPRVMAPDVAPISRYCRLLPAGENRL